MHHFDLKFSKFWEKWIVLCTYIGTHFFSFFSSVKNVYWLHQNALRMHLLMQISQNFPGEDLHLREGVTPSPTPPPPFGASRLSETLNLASLVTCAPPPPSSGGFGSAPWRPPFYNAAIYNVVLKHKTQTPHRFTMLLFILYALLHIRISAL